MRMRFSLWGAGLAAALAVAAPAAAQQTPKYGGILTYMIPADAPPSFDGHRETTYATIHSAAPFYSTLIRINPYDPASTTDIVCDLCTKMPKPTDGGKTYTFEIRKGVTFHNGDPLTAADVAASLNEIVFPPKGVLSPRANTYPMVKNIEATGPYAVVIHLKFPTPAFLPALASPYNWIYQKKILGKNPHWYEHHILGSGPFQFVSYQVGQSIKGKRYDKYYHKGLPYLDGFVGIYAPKQAVQLDAIRADQAATEFRGYPPSAINQLKEELGDKIKVQTNDWNCTLGAWINQKKKPFDDVRVRRALSLAINRWGSQKGLSQITLYKTVGSLIFPTSPLAPSKAQIEKLIGFWPDINKSRAEARKLLKEAGQQNLSFVLNNRNVDQPYKYLGEWLVDQWAKIGVHVTQRVVPTGPWFAALRSGNFQVSTGGNCNAIVNPVIDDATFLPTSVSERNFGYYEDPELLAVWKKWLHATDFAKEKALAYQFTKRVLDQGDFILAYWWYRRVPLRSYVHGWKIGPSHYMNQDLSTIWLSPPHCGRCASVPTQAAATSMKKAERE